MYEEFHRIAVLRGTQSGTVPFKTEETESLTFTIYLPDYCEWSEEVT